MIHFKMAGEKNLPEKNGVVTSHSMLHQFSIQGVGIGILISQNNEHFQIATGRLQCVS